MVGIQHRIIQEKEILVCLHIIQVNLTVAVNVRQIGTTKVKTKTVVIKVKENPSCYMNVNYDIQYNYWIPKSY